MKKTLVASLALGIGIFAFSTANAGTVPGSGIYDTAHDLSSDSTYYASFPEPAGNTAEQAAQNRVCVYCHAPHNTMNAVGEQYLPLWNRDLSTLTYEMYNPGTQPPDESDANGNPINHGSQAADQLALSGGQPGQVSKLCLSCHDGSLAVNTFYGAPAGDSRNVTLSGRVQIGGDGNLTNHHPVGFSYAPVAANDDEIAAPTDPMGTTSYLIGDLLYGGNMECVTCHDVHNTKNSGYKFVWVDDTRSAFCCVCHLKCTNTAGTPSP